jgi:DNA-binding LacI/PurR family transcriptional regulator
LIHLRQEPRFPYNASSIETELGAIAAVKECSDGDACLERCSIPFCLDDKDEDSSWAPLMRLIERNAGGPTALMCGSDGIARLAINKLRDGGIRVPEDVSVVGAGNLKCYTLAEEPYLTTVDWPLERAGCEAIRLLMSKQKTRTDQTTKIILDITLIPRQSTRRI